MLQKHANLLAYSIFCNSHQLLFISVCARNETPGFHK